MNPLSAPTATQDLYTLALSEAINAANAGKPIYSIDFCPPSRVMATLLDGADPVAALAILIAASNGLPSSLSVATLSCAAQFLLCCCCPSEVDAIQRLNVQTAPGTNSSTLFSIENPVVFNIQFWLEETSLESSEFYERVVRACASQDSTALNFWIKTKGLSAELALQHFSRTVGNLQFFVKTLKIDIERFSKIIFNQSELDIPDSRQNLNDFFAAAIAKKAVLGILDGTHRNLP